MQTPRSLLGSIPAFLCVLNALLLSGCTTSTSTADAAAEKADQESQVDFVAEVKPLLEERCVRCHNRRTLPDRTSFETGELAMKGDAQGPVILPGNSAGSRLITAVSSPDFHESAMPPVSMRVSADEKAVLRRWINEGAHWPTGEDGRLEVKDIPLE